MTNLEHTNESQKAYDELKGMGVPVLRNDWGGYFEVSAESNDTEVWADYYPEYTLDPYINPKITEVLNKHGLHAEWHCGLHLQLMTDAGQLDCSAQTLLLKATAFP
jgi:hypothetical protein